MIVLHAHIECRNARDMHAWSLATACMHGVARVHACMRPCACSDTATSMQHTCMWDRMCAPSYIVHVHHACVLLVVQAHNTYNTDAMSPGLIFNEGGIDAVMVTGGGMAAGTGHCIAAVVAGGGCLLSPVAAPPADFDSPAPVRARGNRLLMSKPGPALSATPCCGLCTHTHTHTCGKAHNVCIIWLVTAASILSLERMRAVAD